jgi:hypothetical protein
MLFNSLEFLVFFPIVTLGYFALPQRIRWFWLLSASCFFYMGSRNPWQQPVIPKPSLPGVTRRSHPCPHIPFLQMEHKKYEIVP